jgi:hypothetical protein
VLRGDPQSKLLLSCQVAEQASLFSSNSDCLGWTRAFCSSISPSSLICAHEETRSSVGDTLPSDLSREHEPCGQRLTLSSAN